jgi:hypothetical protein
METIAFSRSKKAHPAARRLSGECKTPNATIALVAKFKPAKPKKKNVPAPQGAIPCIILVILVIAAVMLMLVFVMKSFTHSGT